MKNKYLIGFLLSILIFSSCANQSDLKFGLMLPNLDLDYFSQSKEYFTAEIENLGGEVIFKNGENNENLQIDHAQQLIDEGVSVIVLTAINANTAGAIVRIAHENNVKVIALDRIINNCDLDFYISYDSEKIGQLMATYAFERNPTGNYVLFYGDSGDDNSLLIKKGMFSVLEKPLLSGKINLIYNCFTDNWDGVNAYFKLKKILDYSDKTIDVLLSSYDGMSTKSILALEEFDLDGKVLVTGQNGEAEAFQNIMNAKQAMTLYKPAELLSVKTAEIAWRLALDENINEKLVYVNNKRIDVESILLDPILVDKNNIKTEIIDKGIWNN